MENQPITPNESSDPKAGRVLGIIGLVLGILALVISFIPCLGVYAMFPGIIAIVLSVVAFIQANKAGASKGLIIAALVVSVIGTGIAGYQYYWLKYKAQAAVEQFGKEFGEEMQKALDTMKTNN